MEPRAPDLGTVRRRSGRVADVALALALLALGAIGHPTLSFTSAAQLPYALVVVGCCAAAAVRRSCPRVALLAITLLLLLHLVAVPSPGPFALAMCIVVVYTAQSELRSPERWIFTAGTVAGSVCGVLAATRSSGVDWWTRSLTVVAAVSLLAVVALIATVRHQALLRHRAGVERVEMLHARQQAEARLAAVEERAAIAREMHDILGHSMNVIAIRAEAARYALRSDPSGADTALGEIARLSRDAVDEVRELIDVLRDAAPTDAPAAPSLTDLGGLVDDHCETAYRIRWHVDGDLSVVPDHVGRSAYRIVQEALTNASKHAPGASVEVRLTVSEHHVELTIANEVPAGAAARRSETGRGRGLSGMAERVGALGGTIEVGPHGRDGAWRVTARIPWRLP
ncbi:sensor histidine kinase [Arenivirga flava]|uniref:histidine kinase n=1 Tax=Arenivirga flava TaxID=1930060 RepID=A0AA37UI91_9MICO|nr:histidine kinase [Arenivirga flava]GMA27702.1 hypothetical protein GCM10025874_09550 [Arenivirga flava]